MQFKITSRKGIYKYSMSEHHNKSIVISMTDYGSPAAKIAMCPQKNGIFATIRLKFNDTSLGNPHCISQDDAKAIANFVKKHETEDFDMCIFHCEVGMCRSAAVCAAVMRYMGKDYKKIFENKNFKPNMSCFKMVCEALGVPCTVSELKELQNINNEIWENKTNIEKLYSIFRIIRTTNLPHTIRQIKIKKGKK